MTWSYGGLVDTDLYGKCDEIPENAHSNSGPQSRNGAKQNAGFKLDAKQTANATPKIDT